MGEHRAALATARWGWALLAALLAACTSSSEDRPSEAPPAPPLVPSARPTITVFEGARLIVGDGTTLEDAVFVVEDGTFAAVGPRGAVTVPEGAEHVDLTGRTVMPAIIDTHTHLSREREALIEDLRRRAQFGVAAALSLGQDEGDDVFEIREEVIPGAALYRTAGRGITAPEPGRTEIPYWVTSPEEARAAVREQALLGVDIIKIWVDDRNGRYEKLSPEIYRAVIEEAHAVDVRVTAHLFNLADAKELLRAGIDAFAHGIRDVDVDDEVLALFAERPDFVLVPNLPDRGVATDLSWLRGMIPDEQLARLQEASVDRPEAQAAFAIQARNLVRLHEAGVRIALGTDGNVPWGPHLEMADMVAAGMSPADVIVAATKNGAEFLELERMGTVAPGNSADFIVLEADPLEDITNTRRIERVYLRGELIDRRSSGAPTAR
jgi:imidazolonepropionase-like amidohydrolase